MVQQNLIDNIVSLKKFIGSAEPTENVAPSGRGTFDKTPKNETAGSQTMGIEWTAAFSRQSCSVGSEVLELT
jgi:hypothetical protein